VFTEQPYIVASWRNVLMGLAWSDDRDQCDRFLTQPIFYFFHGFVRWLPSTTANNPKNAETEGASMAVMKGG